MNEPSPIPVICFHPSSIGACELFNPNDWAGDSRGVIQSCMTEFAGLQYSADHIVLTCGSAKEACRPHFETLRDLWAKSPWDLRRYQYFAQVPEVHIFIEGFFAGLKSMLDLSVQLVSTEGVVSAAIDGFHRRKDVYGGAVMNALENNVKQGRDTVADAIRGLLAAHKRNWIDDAIAARDGLVHPIRGTHQLMFQLLLEVRDGELVYVGARPPHIGSVSIADYVNARVANVRELSTGLLGSLQQAA